MSANSTDSFGSPLITRKTNRGVWQVLCQRFDTAGRETLQPCAAEDERPWDPDRGEHLKPGGSFQRLRGGKICNYEGRVWAAADRLLRMGYDLGPQFAQRRQDLDDVADERFLQKLGVR